MSGKKSPSEEEIRAEFESTTRAQIQRVEESLKAEIVRVETSLKTGILDLIEQMKKAMSKQGDLKSDLAGMGNAAAAIAQANPMVVESIGRLRYISAAVEALMKERGVSPPLPSVSPPKT